MMTGHPVFTGEPMAVMIHHVRTPPRPPSKISAGPIPVRLEEIVLACLEKAAERRPSSVVELWRQLGEVPLATPWTSDRAEGWWHDHLPDFVRLAASDPSDELTTLCRHEG
jgi:hypothetical protein